jgi:hypothetical protein
MERKRTERIRLRKSAHAHSTSNPTPRAYLTILRNKRWLHCGLRAASGSEPVAATRRDGCARSAQGKLFLPISKTAAGNRIVLSFIELGEESAVLRDDLTW